VVVDKVEAQILPHFGRDSSIGLDPGQIDTFTTSDGSKLRSRRYRDSEEKIKLAQKRAHKKQAKCLHRKVKRQRKDDQQKFARELVNSYNRIWIGDLSPQKLAKSKLKGQAKSIYDAAIGLATNTLQAMGHRAGRVVHKVNESNSTRRCSNCQSLTGPTGLDNCVVRQWVCAACDTHHDRDQNSSKNIDYSGEQYWKGRSCKDQINAVAPRYWRPFAGTR
jgi:IS605 OrfB family transposase